jgi:hypothetical protein
MQCGRGEQVPGRDPHKKNACGLGLDADFERLTRLAKAVRIKLGELGNTLAHLEISEQVGSNVLQPDGFRKFNASTATERRWCLRLGAARAKTAPVKSISASKYRRELLVVADDVIE